MPVALVGWSHGGVIARELARQAPEAVARVITFGTPVVGGAKYTAVAPLFRERGLDLDRLEREIAARNAAHPILVPITAIYSCEDAVVAWQACLDPDNPDVEHVEVGGSHAGLGINPDVFGLVADRLAATPRRPAEAHTP
jgi:pimeloyl-ACP methyl ester carboxylesterase